MASAASRRLVQGSEAIAEGALAAGLSFYAGYPITPSGEIADILARQLPRRGGVFIQMEDEIASIAAVIGAALGGARAATATSGPGFSLMQENIGFAAMAETPCVIINVQRLGPSTGVPTVAAQGDVMQARWGAHGDHPIIVLCPSSVAECYALTARAFGLAERYRTPVILLADEVIAHMREPMAAPQPIVATTPLRPSAAPSDYLPYDAGYDVPPFVPFGEGYRYHVTGLYHDERGLPTEDLAQVEALARRLQRKLDANRDDIVQVVGERLDDAELAIVGYGVSARSARHAMVAARERGLRVGMLKLLTLWPFADDAVAQLAAHVRRIVAPEMNLGQLVGEVSRVAAGRTEVVAVNSVAEPPHPYRILEALQA